MLCKIFLIVIAIELIESTTIRDNRCRFSIKYKNGDLTEPQPLILSKNDTSTRFLYPNDKNGYINILHTDKIRLACPGKKNYFLGINGLTCKPNEILVQCINDKIFQVDHQSSVDGNSPILFNITSVHCKRLPQNEARSTTEKCYNDSTFIELGFALKNRFLRTIKVCYDDKSHSTYFTQYELSRRITLQQANYPRPNKWSSGEYFAEYNMDYLYKLPTQFSTVANTVGSEELASKYITPGTARYLSRGHMTAKADFIYGNEQRSTFWYMNAAPQWQSFNGGNWNSLEDNVRTFAARSSLDLDVYTGVHGQMKLNDINGNAVPLYLYINGTNKELPVPQYYWKIIYDPVRKIGTAFVGLNDPYVLKIDDEMFICEDIAHKITWLKWDANKISKGVSYACNIDDIRKVIPSIPKLQVYGILM